MSYIVIKEGVGWRDEMIVDGLEGFWWIIPSSMFTHMS